MSVFTYEPMAGDTIEESIRHLCTVADEYGEARMLFNDIIVEAKCGDTPAEVHAAYLRTREQLTANHEASNTYRDQQEVKRARRDAQLVVNACIRQLRRLDFTDQPVVLCWIDSYLRNASVRGVVTHREEVDRSFKEAGFRPNENTGTYFVESDRDNVFRYLVGQMLASHPVPGIIHDFIQQWLEAYDPITVPLIDP